MEITQLRSRFMNLWLWLDLMIYASAWLMPLYLEDGRLLWKYLGFRIVYEMVINPMYPFAVPILWVNGLFGGCWLLSYLGGYRPVAVPTGVLAFLGAVVFFPFYADPDNGLSLGPGYYTWLFSMVLMVVIAFCARKGARKGQRRIAEKPGYSRFFWEDGGEEQATQPQ